MSSDARLRQARRRARSAKGRFEWQDPLWPAQVTILTTILLGLALPERLTIGAPWTLPAIEAVLFVALIVTTPHPPLREIPGRRQLRIALVALVSAVNVVALLLLVEILLNGGRADAKPLLLGGVDLWLTAVLLFAVWFWELDRGGPVRRLLTDDRNPDFVFPQMEERDFFPGDDDWRPGLDDYLYLSLSNAASLTPPENTVPLTITARLLLAIQTLASLTTFTVILSYAINNLH
jgi:hypothetical protein